MVFLGKEIHVEGIFIVFEYVYSQPCTAHRPYTCSTVFALRSRITPYIGMTVAYETLVYTIHLLGCDSTVAADALK